MNEIPQNNPAGSTELTGKKLCVVYDCLFPFTHGGAERWYRVLVDRLVVAGADVTYLTRRQWLATPEWTGVNIVAVSGESELYDDEGTRRTVPAVEFGIGTFRWMLRNRDAFDAVVVANFPYFSLLAIRAALLGTDVPICVDYHEVWSPAYWKSYAGQLRGALGALVERLCIRVTPFAQVFTEESARRLRQHGFKGDVKVLAGLLPDGPSVTSTVAATPSEPVVLFVGRHVKHKGVRLLAEILQATRRSLPAARMVIVSDGPERADVERDMARLELTDAVEFAGSVSDLELRSYFSKASCTIVPSFREGYGIVVAESVSVGTPVVVANNPENLATGLVESGVNGFVVEASIAAMSKGILDAIAAGPSLRWSTAEWASKHTPSKSIQLSADEMVTRLVRLSRG